MIAKIKIIKTDEVFDAIIVYKDGIATYAWYFQPETPQFSGDMIRLSQNEYIIIRKIEECRHDCKDTLPATQSHEITTSSVLIDDLFAQPIKKITVEF